MKSIEISDQAYEKIQFAAAVAGVSVAVTVDRMVEKAIAGPSPSPPGPAPGTGAEEIAVTATYRGHRLAGFLDVGTERLRITEAPTAELIGSYRTPSHAAVEAVRALNPARHRPETNGWRFWVDVEGRPIDRYRRQK